MFSLVALTGLMFVMRQMFVVHALFELELEQCVSECNEEIIWADVNIKLNPVLRISVDVLGNESVCIRRMKIDNFSNRLNRDIKLTKLPCYQNKFG